MVDIIKKSHNNSENWKPFEFVEGISAKGLERWNDQFSTQKGETINLIFFSAQQMFQNKLNIKLTSILDFE